MSDDAAYAEALRAMYWREPIMSFVLIQPYDTDELTPYPWLPSYSARYGASRIMVATMITLRAYLQSVGLCAREPQDKDPALTDSCRTDGVIACDGSCEEWPRLGLL